MLYGFCCFQWFKDTKMKANHNAFSVLRTIEHVVSSGSKILKWKQITTIVNYLYPRCGCFQWFKDTKMKANHNRYGWQKMRQKVVSSGSKILKWKQITTRYGHFVVVTRCFQWFKDTKMKANHNVFRHGICKWLLFPVVQRY